MHGNKRVWTDGELKYLKENYYKKTNSELAQEIGVSRATIDRKRKELGLFKRPVKKAIEQAYGVPIKQLLINMHHERQLSVKEMSKILGVARTTITSMMEKEGIPYRSCSEAQRLIWKNRSDEERKRQVKNAHKRNRELAQQGELSFQRVWREKPEEMREQVRKNAIKMVKNRRYNWMKGRTGSKHPNWNPKRTKEYRIKFRKTEEHYAWVRAVYERDNFTCQICGYNKGAILNAHHIYSYADFEKFRNDLDNGVTLCEDCHKEFHSEYGYGKNTAEQFKEFVGNKINENGKLYEQIERLLKVASS